MNENFKNICDAAVSSGILRKLETVYTGMDRSYERAAGHYGFSCKPCADNCCLTRFYHHTTIEYAYLLHGFLALFRDVQLLCLGRAEAYNLEMERISSDGGNFLHMCPVNDQGLCLIYEYRPMICRLHGIPHELNPPGRGKLFGAGCMEFEKTCGTVASFCFDRTSFYTEMAELEQQFRKQTNIQKKFKMTVAGMLLSIEAGER